MAKQKRPLAAPTHRPRPRAESAILLQSAESLGRMIGALQRKLDEAAKRLGAVDGDSRSSRSDGNGTVPHVRTRRRSPRRDSDTNDDGRKTSAPGRGGSPRRARSNGRRSK